MKETFTDPFWSWFIIVLTVANILACWWLIRWTTKRRPGETGVGEVTAHTWDEDLQEYNNPLPRWWLWLFYITIVFSLIYLVLYPGAGAYPGVLGWSKEKQYQEQLAAAKEKYGPIFAQYAEKPVTELAKEAEPVKTGRRLFLNHCATCHGSDAGGAPGFPNLRDDNWQWGNSPQQIKATILNGRTGAMPAWKDAVGAQGVEELTAYVQSLSGRSVDAELAKAGRQHFQTNCVACHGQDGKGSPMLGAPDLTDDVWLYGGSPGTIRESIASGRNGKMPAHRDILGEDKAHLLAAYVLSLSQQP